MSNSVAYIESLEKRIKSLQECLPYADHGAYGQDKEKIRKLQEEIRHIKEAEKDL